MGLQQSHRGGEAEVGNSEDSHSAVGRDMVNQPIDRVVGVGRLVDGFRVAQVHLRRQFERALRLETPAQILENEDISVLRQFLEVGRNRLRSFIRHSVWGALEKNGERLSLADGGQDHGLQTDAIPHRHHDFLVLERGFSPRDA